MSQFAGIVGPEHVLTGGEDLARFTVDWTGRYRGTGRLIVRPGSTDQVAAIVRSCRTTGTALVPQGGNTGLVGGSVPLHGEVVLSTVRLSTLGDVDETARQVTVGAGVTLAQVQQAALDVGLRYPVDFGARDSATIGGTIATNAGGISVLRHGMTRRHVVGIEAVLGTGDVVSHLGGLAKDNTGFDLAGLLCGSEGTLGIVTAARLQLVPLMGHRTTALVGFDDVDAATSAVARICSVRDDVDALEIMFRDGVRLVVEAFDRRVPFDAPVYLLLETSSREDRTASLEGDVGSLPGVIDVAVAASDSQRAALWQLRDEHTLAINALGAPLKFDVTVPAIELAAFSMSVPRVVSEVVPSAQTILFGHAADGNLHVNVVGVDPESSVVETIEDVVMYEVVRHRGSISAEHGIGSAKKRFLSLVRSEAEIDTMRSIKRALDPDGILNPDVLFD